MSDDWKPIAEAPALPWSKENEGKPPLLILGSKERVMVGRCYDFTGDDGTVRRGTQYGFGALWMPTHYMPLPELPA